MANATGFEKTVSGSTIYFLVYHKINPFQFRGKIILTLGQIMHLPLQPVSTFETYFEVSLCCPQFIIDSPENVPRTPNPDML